MLRVIRCSLICIMLSITFLAASAQADGGFLYGTVLTEDGEELTGRIRWDKNEGHWDDLLDGNKVRTDLHRRDRRREKSVSVFGIDIYSESGYWGSTAQSGLRFGYIERIIPRSRSKSTVILKGGEKVKFDGGSDLSSSIREFIIDEKDEGIIELDWDDIDEIVFHEMDDDYRPSRGFAGHRLYGIVTTELGLEFEGFIQWDVDEIWSTDILDGDQRSRGRKIPFGRIEKIEKVSSRSSKITLINGRDLHLDGSNDVNDENRGIVVMVPNWGRVKVDWDEFESIIFTEAPEQFVRDYDDFEPPWRLRGTVYTEYGDRFTGLISWDNDEQFSWEMLDGEYRDMEFDIEFGQIKTIAKRNSRSAEIVLFTGDEFRLRGSNDVDDDNKGIVIETDDGDEIVIDWEEFERIEFEK